MTNSNRFNRKKVAAFSIALASVAALSTTTNTAQADIGPDVVGAGDVRVLPANVGADGLSTGLGGDGLDQPAPVIALGADDQAAASAQIRIHNEWRSGDRVLFQVRDSAGANCANVAKSIGYSATPTVVSSINAYAFPSRLEDVDSDPVTPPVLVAYPDSPFAQNLGGGDGPVNNDGPAVSTTQVIQPEFQVNLLSSTQCSPNGINDIVEILFTNQSAFTDADDDGVDDSGNAVATDAWVLTMSGITYDVGTEVTAGPLRNLPLSQNATATPGIFINTTNFFGGNQAANGIAPLVQELWTTTAFILPVRLEAVAPNALVADGFTQNLGTITLTESAPDGFNTGVAEEYTVCYTANIANLVSGITTTGPVVPGSVSVESGAGGSNNCIEFDVNGTAALNTVVLSNIFGSVDSPGAVVVTLNGVPGTFTAEYLTARDQDGSPAFNIDDPGSSVNSDVNTVEAATIAVPVAVAAALQDRIGGADRFETAAKIAANVSTCNGIVVLVNGNAFADALSATYLAGALDDQFGGDVPILLTNTNSIPQATSAALREFGTRTVYIVGGTAVVSQQVEDQLATTRRYYCGGDAYDNDQNITVNRVAGENRYETNNEVIEAVQSVFAGDFNDRLRYQSNASEPSKRTAIVATGEGFADALTAGPVAYDRFPLILTQTDTLSPEALRSMVSIDIEQVVIFGGESAVSAGVASAIEAQGISVIRLGGADRYETNAVVNNWIIADDFPGSPAVVAADLDYDFGLDESPSEEVFMARGDDFADALASAPLVDDYGTLLVLTAQNTLPAPTKTFLEQLDVQFPYVNQVIALGLGSAISTSVLAEANATVN